MSTLFTFIKSRIPILDVIGAHVDLKKAGGYWKGRCPFHLERTGSFTVSPHKDIYYCFGCHAHGDIISFITALERCSPLEAVQYLAERYTLAIPEQFLTAPAADKSNYYDIYKITLADFFIPGIEHFSAFSCSCHRNIAE